MSPHQTQLHVKVHRLQVLLAGYVSPFVSFVAHLCLFWHFSFYDTAVTFITVVTDDSSVNLIHFNGSKNTDR